MTAAITDFSQYSALRRGANVQDPAVLEEVAGQFEALFIQSMMKNMRDTSLADPIFGQSDQHEMYQEMLDKQFALEMSGGRGIGLKNMLIRQLGGVPAVEINPEVGKMLHESNIAELPAWSGPEEFIRDIWPHAKDAAEKLKVPAEGLLAQAALETGWGRHVMRRPNGETSFNLFGIKASGSWAGPTAVKPTLEYRNGVAEHEIARFRAYDDVAATFEDYVRVVGSQPRFDRVRNNSGDSVAFAEALQQTGYATDPEYAAKINAIVEGDTMKKALGSLKSNAPQPINSSRAPGEAI